MNLDGATITLHAALDQMMADTGKFQHAGHCIPANILNCEMDTLIIYIQDENEYSQSNLP
jgi:hypothetical protein